MKKISIVFLALLLSWQLVVTPVSAWIDCPFGRRNDPYPGLCDLYIDTNKDQICDHSQEDPQTAESGFQNEKVNEKNSSVFWLIFLPLAIYFLHWYVVNQTSLGNKIFLFNKSPFKLIWNLILLVIFLISGISGLLIFFGVIDRTLIWWHANSGVMFVVIAFVHVMARLSYFKKVLIQ